MMKKSQFYYTTFAYSLAIIFMMMTCMVAQGEIRTPSRMIEISADIYEYRSDSDKQLGLFYQYNQIKGSLQNSDLFLHGTENPTDAPIPALDISGSFAKLAYGSIDFNLRTAIQSGRATIISNPKTSGIDGETITLTSGEKVPYTILKEEGSKTRLSLQFKDTGIKFIVTPRIFRSRFVLLNLEIESSEITGNQIFDRGDEKRYELPIVTTRNIKTVVLLPSGRPFYIGGLYTKNAGDVTRKVPILGDLPVLGFFLRGFNKKKRNTETIFKITPTILAPGSGIEPDSNIFESLLRPDEEDSVLQQSNTSASGAFQTDTTQIPQSSGDVKGATKTFKRIPLPTTSGDVREVTGTAVYPPGRYIENVKEKIEERNGKSNARSHMKPFR